MKNPLILIRITLNSALFQDYSITFTLSLSFDINAFNLTSGPGFATFTLVRLSKLFKEALPHKICLSNI